MHHETSDLYFFNPTCEYAVANGNASWQANKLLRKMESDLATLPMFFARPKDYVLVENIPGREFSDSFRQLNIELPHFIRWEKALVSESFLNQDINRLLPWGWSPAAHKRLQPLKRNCSDKFKRSPVFEWKPEYRDFYSKKFGLSILRNLLEAFPNETFISKEKTARVVTTKEEFETLLSRWGKLMVKAPWSSSGRGLQPVTKTPVHEKVWEKLLGIVNEQAYAIVEPYLNKVLDIAFQFEICDGKIQFLGISNFTTDAKGQYTGNHLNGLPDHVDLEIKTFIEQISPVIINALMWVIENSELAKNYEGNFGVDALVFRDKNGDLKINPCLEINLRQNMGLLALQLEKLLPTDKHGTYKMWYKPGSFFKDFKSEMEEKFPLVISDGKIESGFLSLTEARDDGIFGAYLIV